MKPLKTVVFAIRVYHQCQFIRLLANCDYILDSSVYISLVCTLGKCDDAVAEYTRVYFIILISHVCLKQ